MNTDREAGRQDEKSGLIRASAKQRYLVVRFLVGASGSYAWRSLKNCVKFLTGRKTYFDENGLFLRQYVLHLTGIRPIRTITCTGLRSEGAGSQALMVMNAINFARSFGLTYQHTPFSNIQHAERPVEQWTAAWERLFNLGAGEAVCNIARREVVDFCYSFSDLDLCFGWRHRGDELADRFKNTIPEFRRKYYLNKSPRTTEEVTVAVHIRRGDVSANNADYFTGTETIVRTLTAVKSMLDTHKVKHRIRVYSQGQPADFANLSLLGVELFLDVDAVWTMQELIEADILIMAKGCFSYYAALISDGIKIFEPVTLSGNDFLPSWKWRSVSMTENWIPRRADGSFDCAAFERQLLLVVQAKAMAVSERHGVSDQIPI
ncbi:MAG: hypothetical protein WAU89_11085 [Candidatus Acidiferrales bacterium]